METFGLDHSSRAICLITGQPEGLNSFIMLDYKYVVFMMYTVHVLLDQVLTWQSFSK